MTAAPYTAWLKKTGAKLTTADGVAVTVYELNIDHSNSAVLTKWAKHFREHYQAVEKLSVRKFVIDAIN